MAQPFPPSATDPRYVLVVGGVGVDLLMSVPVLPVPMSDTVHVPPIRRALGHTGSGWALSLHALGVQVHLADLLGEDLEGTFVRQRLDEAGLPFAYAVSAAGTRRSVNLVAADGVRQSFYDGRDQSLAPDELDFCERLLPGARHVHVSINDWTRPLLHRAADAGLTVSTDLHDWDGQNTYHEEFALAADLVTMSEIGSPDTSAAVAQWILAHGRAQVVVTTAGDRGATAYARGQAPVQVPAYVPDAPVVDSTGAGDAFGAGFLAAWLDGLDAVEATRFGAVTGALACTAYGVGRRTTREEVSRALQTWRAR